jgi:hypothetical protein
MQQGFEAYRGRRPVPWGAAPAGCCHKCGQPSGGCGCRDCRKEAKSLLVPNQQQTEIRGDQLTKMFDFVKPTIGAAATQIADASTGAVGTDFIGGECCVTLSVEYAATVATAPFLVAVFAVDSEGTMLLWARAEQAGTSYRVHECIITAKPGARLTAVAVNCTLRVRWCEVFSC